MEKRTLKVLFLAAEADPFVKVGGLGDVGGSLPKALRSLSPVIQQEGEEGGSSKGMETDIDVRLVIPWHGAIEQRGFSPNKLVSFERSNSLPVDVFELPWAGLPVYFISTPYIQAESPVYSNDLKADGLKYVSFSLAALELANILNWKPDVLHANDWHTAPAVYALSLDRQKGSFFAHTATIMGLHNLPYLGSGASEALATFKLPPVTHPLLPEWARYLPLVLGLYGADHIVVASPNYAREILTPEFGSGLHVFLRSRAGAISGILNGLDIERWDPATDPALVVKYDRDHLQARLGNKLALQQELGLPVDPGTPLFGLVSRMDYQKGIDLIPPALQMLGGEQWQAVILGTGDASIEASACRLETDFPDRARATIRFDAPMSRRIFAGADALLIPSRYEPCGLTQLIAMRYGCIPIARATGGLQDTIVDYQRGAQSTGFLFQQASSEALAEAMRRAIQVYQFQEEWQGMQLTGMAQDLSWRRFAYQYFELYSSLAEKRKRL